MSEKFHGGGSPKLGTSSVSVPVLLRKTSDNTEQTGIAHTQVTARYTRQGSAPASITMASLASATASFSSGGWFEYDATNQKGVYRFDLPDAMWASGVDWVVLSVQVASTYSFVQVYQLTERAAIDNYLLLADATFGLNKLVRSTVPGNTLDVAADGSVEVNSIGAAALALINAELVDVLSIDTMPELPQAIPPATPTVAQALMLLYMSLRNKLENSTTQSKIFNDVGTNIATATLSDTGGVSGTFTRDKLAAGT
jgi:hypothetical protein